MLFNEKKITLKNGKTAILKTPEIEDAEKLLNCIKAICNETNFLARYAEDWDTATIESEEKWIRNGCDSENDLIISCYIDGDIVGSCEISFSNSSKTYHRAGIGISILKKYWNIGIGSAMFEELLKVARAHNGTEIVELEFVEGNDRGQALYEKFGFKTVFVKPNAYKLKDGTYQNLVYMQKYLLLKGD